jgi:serine/threonine protein kinase
VPTARRQLIRSVRLMRDLAHPNVAEVEATFEDEINAKGYIQMPLYIGGPLLFWLNRLENKAPTHPNTFIVQRLSERGMLRHVRSLRQVLAALAHIHDRGLVHGDLKLGNALVDHDGNVKLSDFDLSRNADDEPVPETKAQALMTTRAGGGTPTYMAPEVQRKKCATAVRVESVLVFLCLFVCDVVLR